VSAATAINSAKTTIINNMWNALVAANYTTTWNAEDEEKLNQNQNLYLKSLKKRLLANLN
jgi:hypothetical protein